MKGLRILRSLWRQEFGQGLVVGVLSMVVVLGFAAMAVDVGLFLHERRELQKAADAAALAGVQELPESPVDALQAAEEWAYNNGIDVSEVEGIEISTTYADDDTVTVSVQRDVPFVFARVLGFTSGTMHADATARMGSPSWSDNVMPWSLLASAQQGVVYGTDVILKYSAQDSTSGDYGILALAGASGADDYYDAILNGSDTCIGCVEMTEPGNIVGKTEAGLKDRLELTSPECDTFEEVFIPDGDGWRFSSNQCNPWDDEGTGSKRVVLIPVIDDPDGGRDEVTVIRFALVFLTNDISDDICPTGQECDVGAIFVKAYDDIGSLIGPYNPDIDIRFARLVE
jgi:Flp pilus assembly protein TadG